MTLRATKPECPIKILHTGLRLCVIDNIQRFKRVEAIWVLLQNISSQARTGPHVRQYKDIHRLLTTGRLRSISCEEENYLFHP